MNDSVVRKHLVLLCGGKSAEHEVSFQSAAAVLRHLDRAKYQVSALGIRKDGALYAPETTRQELNLEVSREISFPEGKHWVSTLTSLTPVADVVFPVLHGPFGEDGTVQGALEVLNIPYVGAGVWGSAVGMNKLYSKKLLQQDELPVLSFLSLIRQEWNNDQEDCLQRVAEALSYPIFVKPANLGSSIGVNKSASDKELLEHIDTAFRYDDQLVVEQGIDAREIEVSVLGNSEPRVSVAGEIIPSGEFYSYEAKYLNEASQLLIPAPLSQEEMEQVQDLAVRTFRALQLEGMARIDFLMDRGTGQFWISEPNTIPGFTEFSMYPKLWEASGLQYSDLLDTLIQLGLERHQRRSRFSVDR
ncbi:MAG: D-alanine--D-alanine ligase family protein [Acidobacteriota bacterium]